MTENEAIQQLEFDRAMALFDPATGEVIKPEILKALNKENYLTYMADEVAIKALKEIQQYRAIGTVEECREAMEKQRPKKPHRNYKKFSGLWCKCGWYLGQKQCLDIKYCPNCGQAIDENLEGMEE